MRTRGATAFALLAAFILTTTPAIGRSAGMSRETWSESRIRALPSGVRDSVQHTASSCGAHLSAGAGLDRYLQDGAGDRFIALHFHDLRCGRQAVCNTSGCLHQVYVSSRGGYRLVWSGYVGDVELKQVGGGAALEISCSVEGARCSPRLRWDGSRFVSSVARH
jgi:hypothetical protein